MEGNYSLGEFYYCPHSGMITQLIAIQNNLNPKTQKIEVFLFLTKPSYSCATAQMEPIPQHIIDLKLSPVAGDYQMEWTKEMINFLNGTVRLIAIPQEMSKLIKLPIPHKDNALLTKSAIYEDYYSNRWIENEHKDWKALVNHSDGSRYIVSLRKFLNRNNDAGKPDRGIVAGAEYIDSNRVNRQFNNSL